MLRFIAEEAVAIIGVLLLAFATRRCNRAWFRVAERGFGQIARRRALSVALVGMLAFALSATLSLLGRTPEPGTHDEFSYLLAADTFANGRVTNPVHPLWVHFESFHIIHQPSYASKYPPAQGLVLALGQVIGGHPIVGVWLGAGLVSAALCWMLFAWVPPAYALLGGVISALHPSLLLQWGNSYWGGDVACIGGALLFGALRRVIRLSRARDALLLGVGVAILANTRPYEGLLVSVPAGAVLVIWMLGKRSPTGRVLVGRIVLPIFVVLACTGTMMAYYNWRVTGNPLRLPYQVHEGTYAVVPAFLWQNLRPEPTYNHAALREFHAVIQVEHFTRHQSSIRDLIRSRVMEMKDLWVFFQASPTLRLALTIPLLMLPWILQNPWSQFALLTCGVMTSGLLALTWVWPHYAAPATGLYLVIVLQGMRRVRLWNWRGQQIGRWVVWTLMLVTLGSFARPFRWQLRDNSFEWRFERARIERELQAAGGLHLVVTRYGPQHSPHEEWVYNGADIDGAPVVWVREMDPTQNRKLLAYFKNRHAWLLEFDRARPRPSLLPYSGAPR